MYDDLIYQELKNLNETMSHIALSLGSIAAEGNQCDSCTYFHEGGCLLDNHERYDGPYGDGMNDGCPACPDYVFGPNSRQYNERSTDVE